ncbi:hypothetical protein MMPV_008282 [Pyropia vietnamensis]
MAAWLRNAVASAAATSTATTVASAAAAPAAVGGEPGVPPLAQGTSPTDGAAAAVSVTRTAVTPPPDTSWLDEWAARLSEWEKAPGGLNGRGRVEMRHLGARFFRRYYAPLAAAAEAADGSAARAGDGGGGDGGGGTAAAAAVAGAPLPQRSPCGLSGRASPSPPPTPRPPLPPLPLSHPLPPHSPDTFATGTAALVADGSRRVALGLGPHGRIRLVSSWKGRAIASARAWAAGYATQGRRKRVAAAAPAVVEVLPAGRDAPLRFFVSDPAYAAFARAHKRRAMGEAAAAAAAAAAAVAAEVAAAAAAAEAATVAAEGTPGGGQEAEKALAMGKGGPDGGGNGGRRGVGCDREGGGDGGGGSGDNVPVCSIRAATERVATALGTDAAALPPLCPMLLGALAEAAAFDLGAGVRGSRLVSLLSRADAEAVEAAEARVRPFTAAHDHLPAVAAPLCADILAALGACVPTAPGVGDSGGGGRHDGGDGARANVTPPPRYVADVRFAHAETLIPLLLLFGFRPPLSALSPFGGNLTLELYAPPPGSGAPHRVRFRLHELYVGGGGGEDVHGHRGGWGVGGRLGSPPRLPYRRHCRGQAVAGGAGVTAAIRYALPAPASPFSVFFLFLLSLPGSVRLLECGRHAEVHGQRPPRVSGRGHSDRRARGSPTVCRFPDPPSPPARARMPGLGLPAPPEVRGARHSGRYGALRRRYHRALERPSGRGTRGVERASRTTSPNGRCNLPALPQSGAILPPHPPPHRLQTHSGVP